MFSFFVAVAEGAEGPSSGFEVIGRELAELDNAVSYSTFQHPYFLHNADSYSVFSILIFS